MAGFPLRALLVLFGLWGAPALAAPDAVSEALAAAMQAPVLNCGAVRLDRQGLAPYYAAVETAPLWVSERGAGTRAQFLAPPSRATIAAIRNLPCHAPS